MAVPTFQAIVVIDIESFGSWANPFQVSLRRAMREAIAHRMSLRVALHDVEEFTGEQVSISVPGRPCPPGLPAGPEKKDQQDQKIPEQPVRTYDGIVNHGRTTVHGDQVAGDKTVHPRAGHHE